MSEQIDWQISGAMDEQMSEMDGSILSVEWIRKLRDGWKDKWMDE